MAKPEWGTKRTCPSCSTRYYDLQKEPPTCPSCGAVFDPEALLRSRRARPIPVDEPKRPAAVADAEGEELETEETGAADDEAEVLDEEDVEEDLPVEDIEADADETAEDEEDVLIEDTSDLGEDDDVGEVVDVEDGEEER